MLFTNMNNTTITKNDYKSEDYVGVLPPDGHKNEDYVNDLSLDGQKLRNAFPQMGDLDDKISSTAVVHNQAVEGEMDIAQTTSFVNDGVVSSVTDVAPSTLPALYKSSSDQANATDIKTFLGKPYLVISGVLSGTDVFGTFTPINLPKDVLSQTIFKSKLDGYLGARFSMKIRLVVNGNPFQMGRYILTYLPFGGYPNDSKRAYWTGAHTNTLYERTQLKRIELDVTCDTEGIMTIPFSSVENFYSIHSTLSTNNLGALGQIQLSPYYALSSSSGSTYANYSIYVSFEDVELVGAAVPQMGKAKARTAIDREQSAAGKGPISSAIFSFAKASSAIAEVPIPVVSDFASTVAWALGIAGNTAKALGFSKPIDLAALNTVVNKNARYMGTADGFDTSISLSAMSDNQVIQLPGAATSDLDEMALINIATIPAWFNTYDWTAVRASGYSLATISLDPISFLQNRTFSSLVVTNYTPIAWVSEHFSAWRGSFVFDLKFVKTIFHSGRLAICFYPSSPLLNTGKTSSYADSNYVHREIIDLRCTNQVRLTIPYVSSTSFMNLGTSMGTIQIFVLDPLVAPATVPSNMGIIAEVSAGPDFEWARPCNNPTMVGTTGGSAFLGATPQMGEPEPCELVSTSIGSTGQPSYSNTINAEVCIGEKVLSFRSLLKIFRIQRLSSDMLANNTTTLIPSAINATFWDSTPTLVPGTTYGDLYDEVGACFLYSRGSMRIKMLSAYIGFIFASSQEIDDQAAASIARSNMINIVGNPWHIWNNSSGRLSIAFSTNEGFLEVQIPQYTLRHSRNNIAEIVTSVAGFTYSDTRSLGSGECLNITAFQDYIALPENFRAPLFRAVGDDFSFHEFVSTVPVQRFNGTTYL
jgi:hypothetical protein